MSNAVQSATNEIAGRTWTTDNSIAAFLVADAGLARAATSYAPGGSNGPSPSAYAQNDPWNRADPVSHWDPQSADDLLNNPNHTYRGHNFTGDKNLGYCAPAVREALTAAGVDMSGHPVDAKVYANRGFLQSHGFTPQSLNGYTPKMGDVAVWQPPSDHSEGESGHIEYYDGQRWHSDYIQRSPTRGPFATDQYGKGFSPGIKWTEVTVFRHQ